MASWVLLLVAFAGIIARAHTHAHSHAHILGTIEGVTPRTLGINYYDIKDGGDGDSRMTSAAIEVDGVGVRRPLSRATRMLPLVAASGWSSLEPTAAPGPYELSGARTRTKRKVLSRGGHYIVRSRSGSSPWSSTSYGSTTTWSRNRQQDYGWNNRGPIGDGGTRTHSAFTRTSDPPHRHNRRATRVRLNKSFKREIARYAMRYGAARTAKHYEKSVGRRLKVHVIEKFVARHKESLMADKKKRRRESRRASETTTEEAT